MKHGFYPPFIEKKTNKIPVVVADTINYLEKNGLDVEGIFRKSGRVVEVKELKDKYKKNEKVNLTTHGVHEIAGLLKQYFRDLTDPLCTYENYDLLIAAVGTPDARVQLETVKRVLDELPLGNRVLLRYLVAFLVKICEHEKENKMTPENVAIVFAPNLLAPQSGLGNTLRTMIDCTPQSNKLLELLIRNYKEIFADFPEPSFYDDDNNNNNNNIIIINNNDDNKNDNENEIEDNNNNNNNHKKDNHKKLEKEQRKQHRKELKKKKKKRNY